MQQPMELEYQDNFATVVFETTWGWWWCSPEKDGKTKTGQEDKLSFSTLLVRYGEPWREKQRKEEAKKNRENKSRKLENAQEKQIKELRYMLEKGWWCISVLHLKRFKGRCKTKGGVVPVQMLFPLGTRVVWQCGSGSIHCSLNVLIAGKLTEQAYKSGTSRYPKNNGTFYDLCIGLGLVISLLCWCRKLKQ